MPGEGGAFASAGRSVVGAGFALPRDAGRRPALQEGAALTSAARSVVGAGFALPRDAGRRPPPGELASAPRGCGIRGGRAQCCRRWFRAPARHSRWLGAVSSALVSRSRAMPVGDRRSRRGGAFASAGRGVVGAGFALPRDAGRRPALQEGGALALAGRGVVGAGFALPRDAGRRPPPGELASAPGGWGIRVGWARCCRGWFRAPARCRSEAPAGRTGQRSKRVRHSRWLGAVLSVLVSRSRAMPVGDRRSNWPALQVPRSNLPCP